jgi:hypothetical protein
LFSPSSVFEPERRSCHEVPTPSIVPTRCAAD